MVAEDIAIPSHWGLVQNTPSTGATKACRRRTATAGAIPEPRGRMPGGTSNLYALMHIRGHRSDYDNWAYNGCPGWGFDDVLPYFQKLEDQEDDTSPLAGKGGPLRVASVSRHDPSPVSAAFIEACIELGFPRTDDFNGPQMLGTGWHHVNIKDGKRHSMEDAYLYPALDRQAGGQSDAAADRRRAGHPAAVQGPALHRRRIPPRRRHHQPSPPAAR